MARVVSAQTDPAATRVVLLEEVGHSILEEHDAARLHPEWIRGYYGLVGGGAGFVILDVEDLYPLKARKETTTVESVRAAGDAP